MFSHLRAAGFAAAVVASAAGAVFAQPGQAVESASTPVVVSYTDHIAANLDASALAPAPLETPPVEMIEPLASAPPVAAPIIVAPAESARSLSQLVADFSASDTSGSEQECLAGAVYFESKGEPLEGQLAVAEVVINRTESGRFPTSICGVVKQRSQFSFVRGGRIPAAPKASAAWRKAVAIAHIAQNELASSAAGSKSMFFHANYVRPGWKRLTRVGAVGNHIFYR